MKLNSLAFLVLILLVSGGCGAVDMAPVQELGSPRSQAIRSFWSAQDSSIRSRPDMVFDQQSNVFDPRVYPSEAAVSFLSAWLVTGESRFREDAVRQLEYARSLEDSFHYQIYPEDLRIEEEEPLVSTNAQARLVQGYFLAWKILEDRRYLDWADQALTALLSLPLSEACWQMECFPAWAFLYTREASPQPWTSCFVNPNQNAVIGLVLTLLHHEPLSAHFGSEETGLLALSQLRCAMVMMDDLGRVPLSASGGDPQLFDTRYGHYTLLHVLWAQRFWNDPQLQLDLQKSNQWVDEYNRNHSVTLRYYPEYIYGPVPDPTELYSRYPMTYFLGGDMQALEEGLDEVWLRHESFTTVQGGFISGQAVLHAMGIPRRDYWPEEVVNPD